MAIPDGYQIDKHSLMDGEIRFPPNQPIEIVQVDNAQWVRKDAEVIVETPVSLTVNGEVWLTFMCTPIDLEALAIGFLFNEGVIKKRDEVVQVRVCAAGDNIDVWLDHSAEKPDKWRRTSGCTGGFTSVDTDAISAGEDSPFPPNGALLKPEQISKLVEALFESQDIYKRSGGVHTSILTDGHLVHVVGEDIGRHNTLDKLAGKCLWRSIELSHRILITTGRISSEMIQKAARMGASIVISRTSPSSMSIQLADRWGITLIGYARRSRFTIYAHPERIMFDSNEKEI